MEKSASLTQAPPAFSSVKFTIIGQQPDLLKRMSDTAAMSASDDGGNWSPPPVPRSPMSNDNQAEGAAYTKSGRPSLLQTFTGGEDTQFASASEISSTQGSDEAAGARSRPLPPVQTQAPSTRAQYSSAGDRSARSLSQSRKASTGSSNSDPVPTLNPNLSTISSNFGPLAVPGESGFSNLPSIPAPNVFNNNNSSLGSQTQLHTPQQSLPQQPQLSPTPDLVYPPDAVSNGGRNHSSYPPRLPLANQHEASGTKPNDHDRLNPDSISKIDSLKASVAEKVLKVKATIAQNGYSTNTATGPNPGQDTHLHNQAGTSALHTQSTLRSPSRSHSIQADAQSNSNSRFSPGDTRDGDHTHAKASTPQASSSSSASASHPTNSFPDSSSSVPVAPPDIDSILSSTRKIVDDLVSAQAFIQMLLSRAESIESRNTSLQLEVNRLRADNGRLQGQSDQLRIEKTSLIEQIELLREELQTSEERERRGRQAKDAMEVAATELLRVTEQITDFAEEVKQLLSKHIAEREVLDALDTGTRYENQLKDRLQHERAEALSRQREGESNRMQVETTHGRRSPQTPPPAPDVINQTTQPPTPPPTLFRNVQQRHNEKSVGGEVALGSMASENTTDDTQGHFREASPSGRSSDVDLQMSDQNSVHVNMGEKVRSVVKKEEEELYDAVPSAGSTIPEQPKPADQNNSPSLIAPLLVASPSNRSAFPDCSQHDQPHSINCPSPQSHVAGSNTRAKSKETLPPGPLSPIVSSNDRQVTSMSIAPPATQASNHSSRQDDGTRMPEHGLGYSGENTTTSNSISPSLAAAPIGGTGGRLASDKALAPNSRNSSHTRNRSGRPSPPVRPVTTLRRQSDHYSPSPPPPAIRHRRHYPPSASTAPLIPVRHYTPPHPAAHHEPTQARNRKRPREEVMDSYRNEHYSPPPRRARLEDFDRQADERDISPRIDSAVQWNRPRTPPIYGPRTPPLPSRHISGWPQYDRRVTTEWMHSYESRAYEPDPVLRQGPSPQHLLGAEQEPTTNVGSGSLFSRMKDSNHHSQNPANHPSQQPPHTLLDRMSDSQGNSIPSRLYNQDQTDTQSLSIAAKRGQHQNRGGALGRGQGPTRGGYGKQPRGRGGRVLNFPHAPLAERLSSSKPSNNPPLHDRLS